MDSFDFDHMKAEKTKALRRFYRFRSICRFFRLAELFVLLLFICWSFTRLPFALQIFREFLHHLAGVISTPLFVFLLGNSIVVVLLTKSSDQATGVTASAIAENEIYQTLVRSVENRSKPSNEDVAEEIIYDDKQVIVTDLNSNSNIITDENIPQNEKEDVEIESESSSEEPKVYRRSKSEVYGKQSTKMVMKGYLERSETEKSYREKEKEERNYPEDNLSNEEFKKTIEAFIAKQMKFRRQESLAVVVHNKA